MSEWPHPRSLDGLSGSTIVGQYQNGTLSSCDHESHNYNRQSSGLVAGSSTALASDTGLYYGGLLEATDSLRFHHLHGRNARIGNSGFTASRPHALGEFNDSIVMSNRPLRDGEIFEIVIERMVERWSGSIEAGVTLIRPEDLEFPNTMTDIDYETWMLSGSAVMQDGQTVKNGYCCDLDSLGAGSRLGMMRSAEDGSLHYTINGEDQGVAIENVPPNIYAVVDLYGQCAQVSIIPHIPTLDHSMRHSVTGGLSNAQYSGVVPGTDGQSYRQNSSTIGSGMSNFLPSAIPGSMAQIGPLAVQENNSLGSSQIMESSHVSLQALLGGPELSPIPHRLSCQDTNNVEIKNNGLSCIRRSLLNCDNALVFSNVPFCDGVSNLFEIQIDEVNDRWAGSLKIGLTNSKPSHLQQNMRHGSLSDMQARNSIRSNKDKKGITSFRTLNGNTYWLEHCSVMHNGKIIKSNYSPSLDRLLVGDRLGVSFSANSTLTFLVNGEDCGVATTFSSSHSSNQRQINNDLSNYNHPQHLMSNHQWWPVVELYGSTVGITVVSTFVHPPCTNTKVTAVSASSIPRNISSVLATSPGCANMTSNLQACSNYVSNRQFGAIPNADGHHMQDSLEVVLEQNENDGNTEERSEQNNVIARDSRVVNLKTDSKNIQLAPLTFLENTGRNIMLKKKDIERTENSAEISKTGLKTIATRTDSYNQGIVLTSRPLNPGELFQVMIDRINSRWSSTLSIGVLAIKRETGAPSIDADTNSLSNIHLPITALGFKKHSRIISGDGGYYENGKRLASSTSDNQEDKKTNNVRAPPNLEKLLLSVGHTVGIMVDADGQLHIYIDGKNHGVVGPILNEQQLESSGLQHRSSNTLFYGLIDLYGQCEQVSIVDNLATKNSAVDDHVIDEDKKKHNENDVLSKAWKDEKVEISPEFSASLLNTHLYLQKISRRPNEQCPYLTLCQRFWISLALPESYFLFSEASNSYKAGRGTSMVQSICYCPTCYKLLHSTTNREYQNSSFNTTSRSAYSKSGDPSKDYALPLGWVAFPLQQTDSNRHQRKQRQSEENSNQRHTNDQENCSSNNSFRGLSETDCDNVESRESNEKTDRHVAYHGSRVAFIRKMLDNGELAPTCELGPDDAGINSRKPKASKEDDSDATPLLFSPTLRYVGESDILCPSVKFRDRANMRRERALNNRENCPIFKAKVAFQLGVHPGSYKVGPPTSKIYPTDSSPPTKPPDSHFKLDETEWLTKERGNTAITAILVQVQLEEESE